MIDYEKTRIAIAGGLRKYLGCPVVRSNQNEEPPNYPYVSYTITTLMRENKGTYGEYEDGVSRKPFTQTWSITVISDDNAQCVKLANKAHEWLDRFGTIELSDNNVIVQSVGSITNRDNFLTTEYEYRNGFDFVLQLMNELIVGEEIEGVIEEVTVNNETYQNIDYNDLLEKTLNGEKG